ncbi:MAG TPA: ATP-dependent DNA helicase RecG [Candidatus Binatia bacterium]|nr:ATP-dependent DNA helicase RecG [Candidatus Binatia bacterium]
MSSQQGEGTRAARGPQESGGAAPGLGLDTPLQFLKGVGPARAGVLAKAGLQAVRDALLFLPGRHEDRSRLTPLAAVRPDESHTCSGTIVGISPPPRGRSRIPFKAVLQDPSGFLTAVWFGRPYLDRVLTRGRRVVVHGRVDRSPRGSLQINVSDWELAEEGGDESLHTGRLVPIYPSIDGMPPRLLRSLLRHIAETYADLMPEPLPAAVRERRGLWPIGRALRAGHLPETLEERSAARRRLAFDDLFLLQIGLAVRRHREGRRPGVSMRPPGLLERRLREALPYRLTAAQERVWGEIRADMAEPHPMNRLLQGDVGSGKTVVAALAIASAVEAGFQAALMAPTEILAEQHARTLSGLLGGLGIELELLTNAVRGRARAGVLEAAASGRLGCVVGTHAVVQDAVAFRRLGLAVVDEQHRFGVVQRAALRGKGESPDVLVMTATPIPRTLALTVYGDLDLSVLDELPPGRKPVRTQARDERGRARVYGFLREEMAAGRQVYVVYPLVAESEVMDLRAATEMAERLQREVFPDVSVGLLHGRMSGAEKDRVMDDFRQGRIGLLVSTTVIEVGIDVPNASVMVIEHAERFGLSQLHQLRGRVGRGPWRSWCILMSDSSSPDAQRRIEAMIATSDGFRIAEVDLELRGPGDFFGTRQAGLPDFRLADLLRDAPLLEEARRDAIALVARDPRLVDPEHRVLRGELLARWRGKLDLASVG